MSVVKLLYSEQYPVNEHISIRIPTVGEVIEHENEYYGMVSLIVAMPIDMMAPLDEMGIDFTKITDYELFLITFNMIRGQDTSMIFGDLDLSKFALEKNQENGMVILRDSVNGIVIDRGVYERICGAVRRIHNIKKDRRKPANEAAKKFMLERAKAKIKRSASKANDSPLEDQIIALVNTEQFGYSFEEVKALTIYQFNESVRQIIKKINYANKMYGVYAGTVSAKDLNQKELNWMDRSSL